MDRLNDISARLIAIDYYNAMDTETTQEEIKETLINNPLDIIEELLKMVEDYQA